MGTFINTKYFKAKHTKRGWRFGIGPSWFRHWYGAGGSGTSTEVSAGPVWVGQYKPDRRRRRRDGQRSSGRQI